MSRWKQVAFYNEVESATDSDGRTVRIGVATYKVYSSGEYMGIRKISYYVAVKNPRLLRSHFVKLKCDVEKRKPEGAYHAYVE